MLWTIIVILFILWLLGFFGRKVVQLSGNRRVDPCLIVIAVILVILSLLHVISKIRLLRLARVEKPLTASVCQAAK